MLCDVENRWAGGGPFICLLQVLFFIFFIFVKDGEETVLVIGSSSLSDIMSLLCYRPRNMQWNKASRVS